MKALALLGLLLPLAAVHAQDAPPPPPPPDTADVAAPAPIAPPAPLPENADLRAEVAALKAQVAALQAQMAQLAAAPSGVAPAEAPAEAGAPPEAATAPSAGGSRALLLPDISFIGTSVGHLSSDRRDQDRSRIFLDSAEMSIQSYVYPGVKADAFLTADRGGDFKLGVEEAYLSVLNLGKGLSGQIGKRKVPFGRVNQLHPHSWLYITQPYALKNLVADESLTGQGATLSYLLPTKGHFFAQLDGGLWNSAEPATIQPAAAADIRTGPGAAFEDRFQTLRLWTGTSLGDNRELELGFSGAHGKGQRYDLTPATLDRPETTLAGADLSYRVFGARNARTLLRGEYLWRRSTSDLDRNTARGFYILADHRPNVHRGIGLRYDWSQFPFAPGLHEAGLSAILTNQLTEQTYIRLQLTHADRPGDSNVNEAWFQWVWGVGPHTHNLE
ncbi:MAG TPA: hypothetical protein VGM37_07340 [Armatimonadota bacterium]|jgi:hypothetical protein